MKTLTLTNRLCIKKNCDHLVKLGFMGKALIQVITLKVTNYYSLSGSQIGQAYALIGSDFHPGS